MHHTEKKRKMSTWKQILEVQKAIKKWNRVQTVTIKGDKTYCVSVFDREMEKYR